MAASTSRTHAGYFDASALETALRTRVSGEVRVDAGSREQIAQRTEREGLHVADLARLALSRARAAHPLA